MDLKGKVAWITGGATGIGGATGELLHKEGCKLLITSRRQEVGDAYVAQFGDDAIFVSADNGEPDQLKAAAAAAMDKWGHIDLLVNCAGTSSQGNFLAWDNEEEVAATAAFERGIKINLVGSYHAARIAAHYMMMNEPEGDYGERGAIVLVGSMASDKVFIPYQAEILKAVAAGYDFGYGSSKAALLGLNRDLAVFLSPYGIRCNIMKPGLFVTEIAGKYDDRHTMGDGAFVPDQLFPKGEGGQPEYAASLAVELLRNPFMNREAVAIDAGIVR